MFSVSIFKEHDNQTSDPIDIHQRSQTSYTPTCNGIVSHGAQIWGLWVFADHTCKKKKTHAKQMHPRSSRAVQRFMRVYLHAQTTVDAGDIRTWRTMVILITEKPEDPQFGPHAGIKKAQVLLSLVYIYEWPPSLDFGLVFPLRFLSLSQSCHISQDKVSSCTKMIAPRLKIGPIN